MLRLGIAPGPRSLWPGMKLFQPGAAVRNPFRASQSSVDLKKNKTHKWSSRGRNFPLYAMASYPGKSALLTDIMPVKINAQHTAQHIVC
jgi:hypothetical protein